MKNKLFLLSALFILIMTGCSPLTSSSSSSSSLPSSSSEPGSESSSSVSSSSSEPSSEPSSSVPSSEDIDITYNVKYEDSFYAEPHVNEQLGTFNALNGFDKVSQHYRGEGVKVAIIDSGFDINHPEFFDKNGVSAISDDSVYISSDNNGHITKQVGKQFVKITDGDSHGTMCAGLLGSRINGIGIGGIASNATLMLIKIDKKAYSMAEAFKYAADNGARVISTSLGAYPSSSGMSSGDIHFPAGLDLSKVFSTNVKYAYDKGVTIVAATGNDRNTKLSYPAGCDYVIGAGGLNRGSRTLIWDNGYEGSNYNLNDIYVDVFAPSDGIYAPGFDVSKNKSTYWGDAKGTSFSAPLIAGAAALYFKKYNDATNKDFEDALKRTCLNISSYNNKNMGYGGLDLYKLLNIEEDVISDDNFIFSSKKIDNVTELNIIDEEGWNFRTLHVWGFTFKSGYDYLSLERFFKYYYLNHIKTNEYDYEGTLKGYAHSDEGYIGDYYLCLGNTIDGAPTTYKYIFPSFVTSFSYQIVNNHNWIMEGGYEVNNSNGILKVINSYFWYDSPTSFGLAHVNENKSATYNFDTINVKVYDTYNNEQVLLEEDNIFAFDKYDRKGKDLYFDKECKKGYLSSYLSKDTILYYKKG